MGFELALDKPTEREQGSNRLLAETFCKAFPQFVEYSVAFEDRYLLAKALAADIGLTPDEYVQREIGLELDFERGDFWIRVEFWDRGVTVTLPNFPTLGNDAAIAEIRPHLEFFVHLGFILNNPTSGAPMTSHGWEDELREAYAARQRQVASVADLTGGTPA
jgi:hypothetical protein